MVSWLERAGVQRICLVDNASTYQPLLEWYEKTPHLVARLRDNLGQLSPWLSNVINTHAIGESYVVTDPDVVPDDLCPPDAIDYFSQLLEEHPAVRKVGFGLRIDDLPRRYRLRRQVQAWESQFWLDPMDVRSAAPAARSPLYCAPIDTTFALYREHTPATMGPALRTGWPYVARHLPWYSNS
ncbi:MAG: glycosyl transferase family 2, partial [Mycobacterium sp.]|nr:glycosyl transferase family 2 [Mycobacterium sp.]